jgi:hypothetical protein
MRSMIMAAMLAALALPALAQAPATAPAIPPTPVREIANIAGDVYRFRTGRFDARSFLGQPCELAQLPGVRPRSARAARTSKAPEVPRRPSRELRVVQNPML